ncbi:MAG: hypothetical protein PUD22_04385 [Erysipelotrichaceae bacterium]|nr:hypothetical protein [Erysipelotrichaceae bacterium]
MLFKIYLFSDASIKGKGLWFGRPGTLNNQIIIVLALSFAGFVIGSYIGKD